MINKLRLLASLLPKKPVEFYDRITTLLDVQRDKFIGRRPNYDYRNWEVGVEQIEETFDKDLHIYLNEPMIHEMTEYIIQKIKTLKHPVPFTIQHNADLDLARLCYALCRAFKPEVVLETGVAYGVTTSFLLKAISLNGQGILYSVDLPPLGEKADEYVGILIPEDLKHNWKLHKGVSKRVLPQLLLKLVKIDFFIHDSLHTYRNMNWEFGVVTPYLSRPGILISDDIEGNRAFHEWRTQNHPSFWIPISKKSLEGGFGLGFLT